MRTDAGQANHQFGRTGVGGGCCERIPSTRRLTTAGRPTVFAPPECEVCCGYEHAEQGGVFSVLLMFLEVNGVARPFTSTAEFPSPVAWDGLPHWAGIEEVALTGPEATEALTQLAGFD